MVQPEWADYPKCDDMYPPYPGELRDSKGVVHGYYGGSSQYDVHMGTGDHNDPQACDQNRGWAPDLIVRIGYTWTVSTEVAKST